MSLQAPGLLSGAVQLLAAAVDGAVHRRVVQQHLQQHHPTVERRLPLRGGAPADQQHVCVGRPPAGGVMLGHGGPRP